MTRPGLDLLPWYYGWNVLAVGLLTVAATMGIVLFSFTFFALSWMEEFGASRGEAMLALSATQVVAGFLMPLSGRALDRHSIRWIGILGIAFLAAGMMFVSFATSMWQVILAYALLLSLADALVGPIFAQTLAARWFRRRSGLAIGIASLGTSLGGLVLPPLVALLEEEYGWRTSFRLLAIAASLVLVPLLFAVVRSSPEERGVAPEPPGSHAAPPAAADAPWTMRRILAERRFWLLVIGFLPAMEMTTGLMTNLGPYTRDLGIDTPRAALLMSLWSATMIAGKVCFGALADRVDPRLLYYFGIACLVCALAMLTQEPSFPAMVPLVIVLGMATGSQLPLVGALIGRHFGAAAFGSAIGLFYLCTRPIAFAAPIAGWVRDELGSYDPFWLVGVALILLCAPAIHAVHGPPASGRAGREGALEAGRAGAG